MKKQTIQSIFSLCVLLLLSACGGGGDAVDPDDRPRILVTVGMLTDVVREIAGDAARVEGLMGEGVDPHSFHPAASDVRRIQGADMIFYVGHHLEGRLQGTFVSLAKRDRKVAAMGEKLDSEHLLLDEDGNIDPHLWMDVSLWIEISGHVRDQLTAWLPESAETFATNHDAWVAQLEALDREIQDIIATIPVESRILITAHDAFGYFGRRYEVEVMGIQGLSTESEAGLRHLNRLVDLIVAQNIPAVFVESSVADRNVRALVEGAASRGHAVVIGGELFSDAMGAPGTPEGTYPGMIRHNARTIANALGGEEL
ncbi:MAG: zinc ABC transporter substrate-binding protein [Verrucomicrobia bacterium]|nr:zinc ABC transporter substrate-binding protein [Verrucomicrobiota bacterium]MCH8510516.1 zinc ABC transporter substrate-binding protein [Kiritimatiellia bacterium]